jgi:F0F1-type ATP synthase delta subunit
MTYEDNLSLKSAVETAVLDLSGTLSLKEDFLTKHFDTGQLRTVTDYLRDEKVNQLSKDELLAGLKKFDEKLGHIKPMDLEIAVVPDDKFKKAVHEWISENVDDLVLPRYTINQAIVGGAKITYGGNFLDLSLSRKIDELPFFKRKI